MAFPTTSTQGIEKNCLKNFLKRSCFFLSLCEAYYHIPRIYHPDHHRNRPLTLTYIHKGSKQKLQYRQM